jgi:hypothetical protein
MTKTPSILVAVPIFVPLISIVAPKSGVPVILVTTPVIFCCTKQITVKNKKMNKGIINFFVNAPVLKSEILT